MYRMLIAEQDEEQVERICEYTRSNFKQIEIVGAENIGQRVLTFVEKNKIDILVITINLKGISGLEVVRVIKNRRPEIHILMISAYDYIEFLKEAMSFGVSDYMLKPLNVVEYSKVIKKMICELDNAKKQKLLEKREDQINMLMDYSFIYTFMWTDMNAYQVKMFSSLLGLGSYGYIFNIEFSKSTKSSAIDIDKDFVTINQTIKGILSQRVTCVVGPKIGKRIIVYVSQNEEQAKGKDAVTEALALANMFRKEFNRCLKLDVRIGLGNVWKISEIHNSYEESIKSLRYMRSSEVTHIKDIASHSISHKEYIDIESAFIQNARVGKQECIEQYEALWDMISMLNIADAKNKLVEILAVLTREVRLITENEVNNLDYALYVKQMEDLDWSELKVWSYTKIEYILKAVRTSRGGVKSAAVKEAMAYMNEHYNEELTLGFISELVNMTPQHFCKIFKESARVTYIDYLKNIRVEHAKEYLLQGKMTISQISDEVGYRDPNYFGRLFKKTVGKSPSQFQREESRSC